jgi:hypothetical protein
VAIPVHLEAKYVLIINESRAEQDCIEADFEEEHDHSDESCYQGVGMMVYKIE